MQSVAVVPHPPLLVPALGREQPQLLAACDAAVADLIATVPRVVVCVGGGSRTTRHPGNAWGTLAGFGADVDAGPPGARAAVPRLPLSLTIGRWLLARGGWSGQVVCQEVALGADRTACLDAGRRLAAEVAQEAGEPSAWLVLADGDSDQVARRAFRDGDPDALMDVAGGVEGRAAWLCLAGAVGYGKPERVLIRYDAAPFDVRYLVASWWLDG